jgi:putative membrane protein
MRILLRWASMALAFWVATQLVPGISVSGSTWSYFWVALIFGAINVTIGSLVRLLSLPAVILTLGLFLVVVNAAMLALTARVSDVLEVEDFWSAIFAAVIISFMNWFTSKIFKKVTS